MTLEEKVGQMTQAERGAATGDPGLITDLRLGSVLSGGGSVPTPNMPRAWAKMVDGFQQEALSTRLGIPIIYGVDAVHGHGNVYGATIFPHNIGLGATRDPGWSSGSRRSPPRRSRATGIPWDFAPCICVTRDARWGRSYESFGEDPLLVSVMGTAAVVGLQGTRQRELDRNEQVLATVKHFAGDGDTEYGTRPSATTRSTRASRSPTGRISTGSTWRRTGRRSERRRRQRDALVLQRRLDRGRRRQPDQDAPEPGTDLRRAQGQDGARRLRDQRLGGHPSARPATTPTRCGWASTPASTCSWNRTPRRSSSATLIGRGEGRDGCHQARIDDAVTRILTKKFQLGLFEHPFADRAHLDEIGSAAHRAVARQAVAESQVLLKNAGNALPLRRNANIYVAGRNADDIGNQSGGWTLTWQGFSEHNPGRVPQQPGTTILDGIRQVAPQARVTYSADGTAPTDGADVAVVAVGETPYSEGFGDVGGPGMVLRPRGQRRAEGGEVARTAAAGPARPCSGSAPRCTTCVVLVVSGRPQIVTDLLGNVDALVASWLPGTEGAGVADVLFGRQGFTGKLPVSWPRTAAQEPINIGDSNYDPLYRYGFGLRTQPSR